MKTAAAEGHPCVNRQKIAASGDGVIRGSDRRGKIRHLTGKERCHTLRIMRNPGSEGRTPKPIVSAVLEDGTIIETLYKPEGHETSLVTCRAGEIEEQRTLDLPRLGRVAPYAPGNNLLTHGVILLPSQAAVYESTEDLLK